MSPRLRRVLQAARPLMIAPIVCTLIWLMTTPGGDFWPMWVFFGCSMPLIGIALSGDGATQDDDAESI